MSAPRSSGGETGGALITVLFLVVILSFVVLSVSRTASLAAQRAFAARSHGELYWIAVGMEALAASAIRRVSEQTSDAITPDNPLLASVYDLPIEGASAQIAFSDQTRCFNINALSRPAEGPAGGPGVDPEARRELMAFARNVGIAGGEMVQLAAVVADWIDEDDFQEPRGAEDNFYTALPTPYRTGGVPLADVTEIRAMVGVNEEFYRLVSPALCAHPSTSPTPINVNLLTPDHAPLLAAVLGEGVTATDAQNIIAERPPGGYRKIADFEANELVRAARAKSGEAGDRGVRRRPEDAGVENGESGSGDDPGSARLAVTSQYLAARGVVEQGVMSLEFNILFELSGGEVSVVSRRIGRRI